jgi:hypothetical protein
LIAVPEGQLVELHASWESIPLTEKRTLRAFLDKSAMASPFQDPAFCGADALGQGLGEHWFVVKTNGRTLAVGYAVENFAFGRYLPRLRCVGFPKGPVANNGGDLLIALRLLEQAARRLKMVYVDVEPQWTEDATAEFGYAAGEIGWTKVAGPQLTLRLDVAKPLDQLLAALDKSTRYEIRRGERSGVNVRIAASEDEFRLFYECYRSTSLRKGFEPIDSDSFAGLAARLREDPARGALLVATVPDACLGGIVVLRSGRSMHYVYGATTADPEWRKLPIGYMLQWRGIELARDLDLLTYDFGGYSFDRDNLVARFKARFGGRPVVIGSRYRRVLRSSTYRIRDQVMRAARRVTGVRDLLTGHG